MYAARDCVRVDKSDVAIDGQLAAIVIISN